MDETQRQMIGKELKIRLRMYLSVGLPFLGLLTDNWKCLAVLREEPQILCLSYSR